MSDDRDAQSPPSPGLSPLAAMLAEARAKGLWLEDVDDQAVLSPDEIEASLARGFHLVSPNSLAFIDPAPELARRRREHVRDAAEEMLRASKAAEWAIKATPWYLCPACEARKGIDPHEPDCLLANAIKKAEGENP